MFNFHNSYYDSLINHFRDNFHLNTIKLTDELINLSRELLLKYNYDLLYLVDKANNMLETELNINKFTIRCDNFNKFALIVKPKVRKIKLNFLYNDCDITGINLFLLIKYNNERKIKIDQEFFYVDSIIEIQTINEIKIQNYLNGFLLFGTEIFNKIRDNGVKEDDFQTIFNSIYK